MAAPTTDIHLAFDSNTDPGCSRNTLPSHGPQWQPRPGHHHGPRQQHRPWMALGGSKGHRHHRPQLCQGYGPRHGLWWQHGPHRSLWHAAAAWTWDNNMAAGGSAESSYRPVPHHHLFSSSSSLHSARTTLLSFPPLSPSHTAFPSLHYVLFTVVAPAAGPVGTRASACVPSSDGWVILWTTCQHSFHGFISLACLHEVVDSPFTCFFFFTKLIDIIIVTHI